MSEQPDLCECEEERAAILEEGYLQADGTPWTREAAVAQVLRWREDEATLPASYAARPCEGCPRVGT